jgi:hypothetical protein
MPPDAVQRPLFHVKHSFCGPSWVVWQAFFKKNSPLSLYFNGLFALFLLTMFTASQLLAPPSPDECRSVGGPSGPVSVLVLPGWQNSGPDHWQSRWEALYGYQRVQQHDWLRPLRGDWLIQLQEAVLASSHPVVLVAHSLGCIQAAAWAAFSPYAHRVCAALLVGPGDAEQPDLAPQLPTWQPIAMGRLPFPSVLVGSQNDPYCHLDRAQTLAQAWGSTWLDLGARGHLNAESGLGDWAQGHAVLHRLVAQAQAPQH